MTIPLARPRILFSDPSRLAAARAWYTLNPFTAANDEGRDENLDRALQALLSQNATTATAAKDWAMSITTPLNAHGVSSDDARYYGEALICTFDWCYDAFSESERATFISRWNAEWQFWQEQAWGGDHINAFRGIPMYDNNYYHGYMRNSALWAIATAGESGASINTFLDNALDVRWTGELVPAAASVPSPYGSSQMGGTIVEGAQYGIYPAWYAQILFQTITDFGRDIYSESLYFDPFAAHIIYHTSPSSTTHAGICANRGSGFENAPVNDDQFWRYGGFLGSNGANAYDHVARGYANTIAGTNLSRWLAQWYTDMAYARIRRPMQCYAASISPLDYRSTWPYDYYVPGTGTLYSRSSWSNSATWGIYYGSRAASNLGVAQDAATLGHQHQEIGSLCIWRGGRWLTRNIDAYGDDISQANPGGRGTESAQGFLGQNGMICNSAGNTESSADLWHGFITAGTNYVIRLHDHADFNYCATNLTDAYEGDVTARWREVAFVRSLETFVVIDRITTGSAQVHSALWHAETLPDTTISSAVTSIVSGTQELRITTLLPASPTRRVVNERTGQFTLDSGTAEAYTGSTLTLRAAAAFADNALAGDILYIESATTGAGQLYAIASNVGATDVVTISGTFSPSLTGTVTYLIYDGTAVGTYRLELDTTSGTQSYMITVLQAFTNGGSALSPSLTDNGSDWTITLNGSVSLNILKGGSAATGGSITISGSTTNFRTTVQSIAVDRTNGPVWGA